ncbi:MAG TPA: HNH endonuclease [Nocardioidaceae bacterium]|nr:HNH endonuclease [Nocardioidaceae bacterium]
MAWELANGRSIPDHMIVMHSCDTPLCIEPTHLSIGTQADNMHDRDRKGRHGRVSVPRKLDEATVAVIKARIDAGESQLSLAKRYGITQPMVSHISTGRRWANVEPDMLAEARARVTHRGADMAERRATLARRQVSDTDQERAGA